jgi:hypothetical protein
MQEITIDFSEIDMVNFLKDMLSLDKNGCWQRRTTNSKLNVQFKGDHRTVQKIIYEWLDIPERKQRFNF